MTKKQTKNHRQQKVYQRDSLEFHRVINLSDAVFAIAMTLLVLTIDIPDVPSEQLGKALISQASQFAALILSFSLVAMIWWQHHSHMALLKKMDPLLIALNMIFLGVVILVPYPTNLIGNDPQARAALIFFILTFILLNLVFMLLMIRANSIGAFTEPMTGETFTGELAGWFAGIFVLIIALIVGLWYPLVSLIILAVTLIIGPILSYLSLRY
jgi:uncharacterized membrane protein